MSVLRGYPIGPDAIGRAPLTVTDIERLAKSGVTINFADIAAQVVSDPEKYARPSTLVESFWERWRRAHIAPEYEMMRSPYDIYATEHGDKVYVYVQPIDQPPLILEDERPLYPSDALMAKLALLEKTK